MRDAARVATARRSVIGLPGVQSLGSSVVHIDTYMIIILRYLRIYIYIYEYI